MSQLKKQNNKQRKTTKKPKATATLREWRAAVSKASRRQLNNWLKTVKNLHSGRVTQAIRQRLSERKFVRQSSQSNKLIAGTSVKRRTDNVSPATLLWFSLSGKTAAYSFDPLHFAWLEVVVLPKFGGFTALHAAEALPTRYLTNHAKIAAVSIGSHRKNKVSVTLSGDKQVLKSFTDIPQKITADHLKLEKFEQVFKPGDEVASQFGLNFPIVVASKTKTTLRIKLAIIQPEKHRPRFIGRLTPLVLAWKQLRAVVNKSDVTMKLTGGSLLIYTLKQQGKPLLKPTLVTAYDSDPDDSSDPVEQEEKDSNNKKEVQALQGYYKSLKSTDKTLAIASLKIKNKEQKPKVERCGQLNLFGKTYDTFLLTAPIDSRVSLRITAVVGKTSLLLSVKTWQQAGIMISL